MPGPRAISVHVHVAVLGTLDRPELRAACDALLSPDERAQRDRLVFENNRREYLYAHALARLALSARAPEVPPAAWVFGRGVHGKPVVVTGPATPTPARALYFSLSHTDGLVACATSREPLVGLDVEALPVRDEDCLRIAQRHFAPPELRSLRRSPAAQRRERFCRYWTLKESFLKARGVGLRLPLDRFWFRLPRGAPATIQIGAELDDDGARWQFVERRPTDRHRLAVALAPSLAGAWTLDIVERQFEDLRVHQPL